MLSDPFSSNINFPNSLDWFPTVLDYGSSESQISSQYTTLWASHYNKIGNAITAIETAVNQTTTGNLIQDGSFLELTYVYSFTPACMSDIIKVAGNVAFGTTYAPPSNVLPFEFILTTITGYQYINWPTNSLGQQPMLVQLTQTQYQNIFNLKNIFGINPMVSCTLECAGGISSSFVSQWSVYSYCLMSSQTIVVRGCIIDNTIPTITASGLPNPSSSFSGNQNVLVNCTLYGLQ